MQKATRQQTKGHNSRLVLRTIYNGGELSRADVARMTGLTRPTVSTIVAELLESDLVIETGQGPSAGGKRPTLLSINGNARHLIAIDLSGTEFSSGTTQPARGDRGTRRASRRRNSRRERSHHHPRTDRRNQTRPWRPAGDRRCHPRPGRSVQRHRATGRQSRLGQHSLARPVGRALSMPDPRRQRQPHGRPGRIHLR